MDRAALEKPKHAPPSPYTCDLIQEAFTKTLGGGMIGWPPVLIPSS